MNTLTNAYDDNAGITSGRPAAVETSNHNNASWQNVEEVLVKHYYEPDLEAAKAVYAAVAAHRLKGAPVWPMLIGPPGSMKTELFEGLRGLKGVHIIDEVTPKTFISGQLEDHDNQRQESPSLLHRIGDDGLIVIPDFSTVLGIKADHRASILAQLRRIYDGQYRREFGTAERMEDREWRGRITCLVAATPEVDKMHNSFQGLGERFVMARWPRAGGIEPALRAMNQNGSQARESLQKTVQNLLGNLPSDEPEVPKDLQIAIASLVEFTVRARTYVARDGNKRIVDRPQAESSTRLAQQLCQLAKGVALLSHRVSVTEEDLTLIRRVAFDCIPPGRSDILRCLIEGLTADKAGLKTSTASYRLEELEALDLVTTRELTKARLTDDARDLLEQARVIT